MASSAPNHVFESNVDIMMRLLGIDLGAASVSRTATSYVSAVRACRKCAIGQSCRKGLAGGLTASSLSPVSCPNAGLLVELVFEALPQPGDKQIH